MKMTINYMAEIRMFNEWLETNELSTSGITLWYALMYIAYRSGWPPQLCIPVSVIIARTKMSRSTIYREREALRDHGLLEFESVPGRQTCIYRILGFGKRLMSHTETFNGEMSQEMSHTGTFSENPEELISHTETLNGEMSQETSHTGTFNENPKKLMSRTETFNPAGVPLQADFADGKNEKTPIYIDNKDRDINGGYGGKKKKTAKSPKKKKPEFDLSFIGDGLWENLVLTWLDYKRSRNESYKSELSVKKFHTMLRNLSRGDPAVAGRVIDKSIANNWAGIFELKDHAGGESSGASARAGKPASGQHIGQIKQPEDEERRRKLLDKFDNRGRNKVADESH